MANLYFRNIAVNWGTAANWSTTADGNTPSAAIPTAADNVFFTNLSGNCNTAANSVCASIDCTGYINTLTFVGNTTVSGNIKFVPAMTVAGTAMLTINAAAIITSAGKAFTGGLTFNAAVTYTLADNLTVNGNFVSSGTGVRTVNGFNLSIGGNLTINASVQGTTNFTITGNCTWIGGQALNNNLTINCGANTLTCTTTVNVGGDFTYQSGTLNVATSTITFNGTNQSLTFGNSATWGNITFLTNTATYTLLSNLRLSGIFTSSGGAANFKTINGFTIYAGGGLNISGSTQGTTNIILSGAGTYSGSGVLAANLTIDAGAGTIAIPAIVYQTIGTFKYISGTVTGGPIQFGGQQTLDFAPLNFAGTINLSNANTYTLASKLMCDNLAVTSLGGQPILAGTGGFEVGTLTINIDGLILNPGNTYIVNNALTGNLSNPVTHGIMKSVTAGTIVSLTLKSGAACNVGYVDFIDIDASAGTQINSFNGQIINCKNVVGYIDPVQSIAKSFAA